MVNSVIKNNRVLFIGAASTRNSNCMQITEAPLVAKAAATEPSSSHCRWLDVLWTARVASRVNPKGVRAPGIHVFRLFSAILNLVI